MTKIGVFDSGVGGLSVARALRVGLPGDEIIFVNDREHMPYGDKSPSEVMELVLPILTRLVADGCQIIVIACNTVTTTLIGRLRSRLPVPLVGIEPMVRPAATISKTGTIAVCATPATLASKRYAWLKRMYANKVRVLEPDCSRWAYMIEHDALDEQRVRDQVEEVCQQGADVVVLGCTHYHWIQKEIETAARGRAKVIQPEDAIVRRVKQIKHSLPVRAKEPGLPR